MDVLKRVRRQSSVQKPWNDLSKNFKKKLLNNFRKKISDKNMRNSQETFRFNNFDKSLNNVLSGPACSTSISMHREKEANSLENNNVKKGLPIDSNVCLDSDHTNRNFYEVLTVNNSSNNFFFSNNSETNNVATATSFTANTTTTTTTTTTIRSDTVLKTATANTTIATTTIAPTITTTITSINTHFSSNTDTNCRDANTSKQLLKTCQPKQIPYNNYSFENNLAKCLVENNINHTQTNALLTVLRTHPNLKFLPKDARTILETPRYKANVIVMPPGEYLHTGFEAGIIAILLKTPQNTIPNSLVVDFSTDGAELNKVSCIWPIQIYVVNIVDSKPEIAGIYKGPSKPNSAEQFFELFVKEVNAIIKKGGIHFNKKLVPFELRCFVADAPARAFTLNHMYHTGKFCCSKCKVIGLSVKGSTSLSGVDHPPRTNLEYRTYYDGEHHKEGKSALHDLPIDLVKQVLFEYIHLVCLGNMKKFLKAIISGDYKPKKLKTHLTKFLSSHLNSLREYCPREFSRKPTEIDHYSKYKATEFRQLLLYTFVNVSQQIINDAMYKHFLLLHVSTRTLLDDFSSPEEVNFAERALKKYVLDAEEIYGLNFLSLNVHGLLHLVADYRLYGSLHSYSAFVYENNMRLFEKYNRKPNQSLQQIYNRREEESKFLKSHNDHSCKSFKVFKEHNNGPINDFLSSCKQYTGLATPNFFYSISNSDNTCILKDGKICIIKNILLYNKTYFFVTTTLNNIQPLYHVLDCPSTDFGVYLCSSESEIMTIVHYDEIKTKCYRMLFWHNQNLFPSSKDTMVNDTYVVASFV